MGEFFHSRQSRAGLRNSGGEIVEVQGGHIVRSISRKDRHSKVCTSKGPKDRRVRLSANTAIQFYDVQDRLGYDRPSKAVDWLIKKAKSAIDQLEELPPWKPTINSSSILDFDKNPDQQTTNFVSSLNFDHNPDQETRNDHELSRFGQHPDQNSSFLPPSLDSDSITDTIKSFFPMGASSTSVNCNSSSMQFHQSFSTPQTTPFLQTLFSQTTEESHLFNNNSQRGPLQSSYTPSIRGWFDQPPFAGDAVDHRAGFSSGGISDFFVPGRFQGEQEEHDGISDKPSFASSDSRH